MIRAAYSFDRWGWCVVESDGVTQRHLAGPFGPEGDNAIAELAARTEAERLAAAAAHPSPVPTTNDRRASAMTPIAHPASTTPRLRALGPRQAPPPIPFVSVRDTDDAVPDALARRTELRELDALIRRGQAANAASMADRERAAWGGFGVGVFLGLVGGFLGGLWVLFP